MKGLKNKLSEDPEFDAKRAHAFSYEDMEKAHNHLSQQTENYNAEIFLIISKLAFYLWLRIDEALNLKWKHITMNFQQHRNDQIIHQVQIAERKTDKTDKHGQLYNIYATPEEPATCLYKEAETFGL
jgi:integrase